MTTNGINSTIPHTKRVADIKKIRTMGKYMANRYLRNQGYTFTETHCMVLGKLPRSFHRPTLQQRIHAKLAAIFSTDRIVALGDTCVMVVTCVLLPSLVLYAANH